MSEYDKEALHRLWEYEKRIYLEFERVCEELGLTFFAAYGTAIGALRHKGFIPWDDDMDVCMPRKDYEIFIEKAPELLKDRFELQEPRLTDGYVLPFAKLTDRKTTFLEATDTDRKYHSGIFVDIFPLEIMPLQGVERMAVVNKTWKIARFMVLSEYSNPKVPAEYSPVKKAIVKMACKTIYAGMKLTGFSKKRLYKKYLKHARSLENGCGEDFVYVNLLDYRAESINDDRDVYYIPDELFPVREETFDDTKVKVPIKCEDYLTRYYGDWRQIPPAEKQHNHVPSLLIFDDL